MITLINRLKKVISAFKGLMATKLSRVRTSGREPDQVIRPFNTWSYQVMWQIRSVITPSAKPLATKNYRYMTCFVGLPTINPQNSLTTRLDEVTWQIKNRKDIRLKIYLYFLFSLFLQLSIIPIFSLKNTT